jgi:glycosyltransferase involved in cell wall biosynthesis
MSPGRGIPMLLEVFSAMKDDRRVMVFMGNGKLVNTIQDYAKRFPNIRYHAAVPYEEIMSYTAGADFGFNTMENVTLNYYYAMPNKLFEYMHAAIPIITNNIYDCRKIVEGGNCGVVIEEFTADGVMDAITRIEAAPREVMVQNLERLREQYQWKIEEKKLIQIYHDLLK